MIKQIIIPATILLIGCGGSSNSPSASNSVHNKIANWQHRQQLITDKINIKEEITGNLFNDVKYTVDRLPAISSDNVDHNYWPTTQDILQTLNGDCKAMSILVYMALLDSQLIDYYNADIYLQWQDFNDSSPNHMILVIQSQDGQEVWITNMWTVNGKPFGDYNIVAEFDLYSIY